MNRRTFLTLLASISAWLATPVSAAIPTGSGCQSGYPGFKIPGRPYLVERTLQYNSHTHAVRIDRTERWISRNGGFEYEVTLVNGSVRECRRRKVMKP